MKIERESGEQEKRKIKKVSNGGRKRTKEEEGREKNRESYRRRDQLMINPWMRGSYLPIIDCRSSRDDEKKLEA